MFDISKSKLYSQIMVSLASFLGRDPNTTTESELHSDLTSQAPLAEQLAAASGETGKALEVLKSEFQTLKQTVDGHTAAIAQKDQELEALQSKIEEQQTAFETEKQSLIAENQKQKDAYESQIATLSGQVASLKAGAKLDKTGDDGNHPGASKQFAVKAGGVVVIPGSSLKEALHK